MPPTSITVANLPKLRPEEYCEENDVARSLAQKNRDLRLYALKTAPEAFAASYEEEVKRDIGQTLERLKNPQADHFFAVDRPVLPWTADASDEFFEQVLSANWIGMIVLIGPITGNVTAKKDPLTHAGAQPTSRSDQSLSEPLHYILNGTFVDPQARGGGVGKALIEAALKKGHDEAARRRSDFHCSVLVDSENASARGLYEKMGFSAIGEESYVQQPRVQMGESRAEERVAIQLEVRRSLVG